jgi:parvulin-like peptidyl-prolyl isomerase
MKIHRVIAFLLAGAGLIAPAWLFAQIVPTAAPAREKNAGALVGGRGALEALEFEGNASFSARALRGGLAGEPEFLAAAHPSAPLAEYLATVRRVLLRGYRNHGFPEAAVAAAPAAPLSKVRVKIIEGPRFKQGEVRVEGAGEVPAAELVRALTEPAAKLIADEVLEEAVETVLQEQRGPKTNPQAEAMAKELSARLPSVGLGQLPANPALENVNAFRAEQAARNAASEAIWRRGEPVSFDEDFLDRVAAKVRRVLGERGHPLATVKTALERDDAAQLGRLVVRIKEGPRAIIGEIVVRGAHRNSREDVLQYLGLAPGQEVTLRTLARAKVALWDSARFYAFDVTAQPRPPPGREVDLTVELEESEARPLLRVALPRHEAALVRFANWFTTTAAQREFAIATGSDGPGPLAVAVSPEKGVAADIGARDGARLVLALGRDGGRAWAAAGGRSAGVEISRLALTATASLRFVTIPDPEKTGRHANLYFLYGFSQASNGGATPAPGQTVAVELIMGPTFACEFLAQETTPTFEGGDVVLLSAAGRPMLRFREATGELVEWNPAAFGDERGKTGVDASVFRISRGGGEFERIRQKLAAGWKTLPAPGEPQESFAALLCEQPWVRSAVSQVCEQPGEPRISLPQLKTAGRLIERVLTLPEVAGWFAPDPTKDDPPFNIPPDPQRTAGPNAVASALGAAGYQMAVTLWPSDTWPAKLLREIYYVVTGNTRYTSAMLDELYRDPRMGPLGSVVTAQLLRKMNPSLAWRFAHRALEHGTAADFREDWQMLLDSETKAGRIAQGLLRALGELSEPEAAVLTSGLPAAESAAFQRVLAALRQNRDQPVAQVLRPLLDDWWEWHLQPDLENRIGALMAVGTPVDAVIVAATVNGVPVSRKFLQLARRGSAWLAWAPRRPPEGTSQRGSEAEAAQDTLVTLALIEQDFRAHGGVLKPEFIDQQMAQAVRTDYGGDRAAFGAALRRGSLTDADYRELVRARSMYEFMRTSLTRDLPPPMTAEIDRLAETSSFLAPDTLHLQAIAVPHNAANTDERRALAESIRAQAVADGSFEKVWAQHESAGPDGPRRYELRRAAPRDLQEEIAAAAFALKPHGVSPVVESGGYFHILYLVGINSGDSPAERRARAAVELADRRCVAAVFAHVDRLRANAIVRVLADPAATATNLTPPAHGTRLEFETLRATTSPQTRVTDQSLARWGGGQRWSGGRQALSSSQEGGWTEWEFTVPAAGDYRLELLATRAMNFCQVQPAVDGKDLGPPLELFGPTVQPSGAIRLGTLHLTEGRHVFRCTVTGRHDSSYAYDFGLDALDLIAEDVAP